MKIVNRNAVLYWGLIVIVALWAVFATRQSIVNNDLYESQITSDKIEDDQYANNLKIWKDKYDKEHTVVEQHRLEKEVFNRYADSASKVLKIKAKQIEGLTQINNSLNIKINNLGKDSTIVYIPVRDSSGKVIDSTPKVKQINFKWDKGLPWISVKGTIGEVDSIQIQGKDSIGVTDYWKRSWLLGPKHYFVDVTNSNPYIKITGARSVKPIVREPKFLLAPSVQIGWYGGPIIAPGISFIYYPLSIKIK